MIITPRAIAEIVPQEHARARRKNFCQWDKDSVDDAGLIKFDLFGLRMLSLIDDAQELIEQHHGSSIDFDSIGTDDPECTSSSVKLTQWGFSKWRAAPRCKQYRRSNPVLSKILQ